MSTSYECNLPNRQSIPLKRKKAISKAPTSDGSSQRHYIFVTFCTFGCESLFVNMLTPRRILLLLLFMLVLSILGIALMIMGVHGSQILTIAGAILLLPNLILTRLGVGVGIPFLSSTKAVSILVFTALQAAYYYGLLQLIHSVIAHSRRRSLES